MVFGTSKDITLGPTAIMSLLTAEFGRSPVDQDATYAILLSLIGGIIQLAMGLFRIGEPFHKLYLNFYYEKFKQFNIDNANISKWFNDNCDSVLYKH